MGYEKMNNAETTTELLNQILNEGVGPLNRAHYLAYMYGPPEEWPEDIEASLPGIFKTVSNEDRVGAVEGSA
tara:strand:- start:2206 stop:2421 length:216 start_codon:yes stop_codon:yes gene_type:complete